MFTTLAHATLHIPDDVERFRAAAGSFSAYPFESQLAVFPKVQSTVNCLLLSKLCIMFTFDFFIFDNPSVLLIQLMQGSHRPVVQMARRLASFSAYCDPALLEFDFETEADPSFDDELFEKELEEMRKAGEIDLPPNIPLSRVERKKAVVLSCTSGGSLSTL
jgi:hypothetical protein